jgi:hypothetical protein
MSGGEQQMLAVARAYMSGRRMMLLDEPSMGLAAADDEHVQGPEGNQRRGHHDPPGGAERAAGAAVRPAGLGDRDRPAGDGRRLPGTA